MSGLREHTTALLAALEPWGWGRSGSGQALLDALNAWEAAGGSVSQVEHLLTIGQSWEAGTICPGANRPAYAFDECTCICKVCHDNVDRRGNGYAAWHLAEPGRAVGAVTDTPRQEEK